MINDIALEPSPALARKLVRLSSICSIEIDPSILILAQDDLVNEAMIDPIMDQSSPIRIAMIQFMLDCNLRAIIPAIHKHMDRGTVLNAIRIHGATHLTIATKEIMPWKYALKGSAIKRNTVFGKLSKVAGESFDQERRNGVLILDWHDSINDKSHNEMMTSLAREFPRTIVYASHKETLPPQGEMLLKRSETFKWMMLAKILFPDMPTDHTKSSRDYFHAHIHRPTWKIRHVDDLSILYNTFLPGIIMKDVGG